MNYDELTPEQQEVWDLAYQAGFDDGIDAEPEDEAYDSGYETGFQEGAKAEQARIQSVLQMMFESSLNMGHGNKAVQYKHAMDLLRPINYQYDEAKYYEDLRNDGF